MLFFELFPLLMLVVTLIVGVRLFVVHREAERTEAEEAKTSKRDDR
jgi:hypothetical protein